MTRRRLGASLPPKQRLVALEARIREISAAVEDLGLALFALEVGEVDGVAVPAGEARLMVIRAANRLIDLRSSPIRAPRNGDAGASVSGRPT